MKQLGEGAGNEGGEITGPGEGGTSFPDIAGEWSMEIHWHRDGSDGRVQATADIRQRPSGISMAVRSPGSDSHTIMAQPGQDATGDPVLHYIYQVEPKVTGSDAPGPYKGAAVLRFYDGDREISGNYWTSQLSKGHFRLVRKGDVSATHEGDQERVDVLLVTALAMERQAAEAALTSGADDGDGVRSWEPREALTHMGHELGTFQHAGEPLFRMALAQPARMGGIHAVQTAAALVERLAPRCLVMCGVCAGNPGDLALGDVVVADLAYQYDEGKLEAGGFVGDHRQAAISPGWRRSASRLRGEQLPSFGPPSERDARHWLLERLRAGVDPMTHPARSRYFPTGEWRPTLEALEREGMIVIGGGSMRLTDAGLAEIDRSLVLDVDPPERLPLSISVGPMASGNVVVKDGVTWDRLRKMGVRSVLGLEMEAAAIGTLAREHGIAEWIVIKGVMDHANPEKDDRYKPFAARASAEALRLFLVEHFLRAKASGTKADGT